MTYDVKDASGNVVKSEPITFTLEIKNPCLNSEKFTLTAGVQSSAVPTDNFSNSLIEKVWAPYTINPTFCTI